MALDGVTIANVVFELKNTILNGRISKIAQPEKDELLLTIKSKEGQFKLDISASASLPLCHLTEQSKKSPLTAPNFCMLLRKHIANGKIIDINQPENERIIDISVEHFDDMGDLKVKHLIVELMGKHSNIIFTDDNNMILDSIKHIGANTSSVREVLPGRDYFIPKTMEKLNPLTASKEEFFEAVYSKPSILSKAIYTSFTGISPCIAEEICYRAGIDSDSYKEALSDDEQLHLYNIFTHVMADVRENEFTPCIIYDEDGSPVEFSAVNLSMYNDYKNVKFNSMSETLENYYDSRAKSSRIKQKSTDLRKITGTLLDRERKKYDLQQKQLKDTEDREKFRIYGELINTYGYQLPEGSKKLEAINYYDNQPVTINLDENKTISENANSYFDKYNKKKRTFEALTTLIEETSDQIKHLESINTALNLATNEDDLVQIKEELVEFGYIKKKAGEKQKKGKSKPFHYLSTEGYDIYVGKNNYQNDELTFKFANGNDWWFHAKEMPGSHVILCSKQGEVTDKAMEEAASLAAYYSSGRDSKKVEIDYIQKKHVKKPNGSKPGFVVYYTNYSMSISPDITELKEV